MQLTLLVPGAVQNWRLLEERHLIELPNACSLPKSKKLADAYSYTAGVDYLQSEKRVRSLPRLISDNRAALGPEEGEEAAISGVLRTRWVHSCTEW